MVSTLSTDQPATLLTTQGIQAIKAGNITQAYTLLAQAIQINPRDEQAWLWLSGAVSNVGERRYCLQQVLAINPQNAGAQRGLALLPPDIAATSPLPAPTTEGIFSGTTTKLVTPAAPQATAAPVLQPVVMTPVEPPSPPPLQLPSLWSTAEPTVPSQAPQTSVPTYAQVASSQAESDQTHSPSAAATYKQTDIDFVVKGFGKHYDAEQIVRILAEDRGWSWGEAHALVAHVASVHSTKVAARQLPLYLFIGVVTLIIGLGITARSGMRLYIYYQHPMLFNPRLFLAFGTGILMTLGSIVGTGQCVRGLWKR